MPGAGEEMLILDLDLSSSPELEKGSSELRSFEVEMRLIPAKNTPPKNRKMSHLPHCNAHTASPATIPNLTFVLAPDSPRTVMNTTIEPKNSTGIVHKCPL
jgi:hypothetical protein